jgi:hypothetical protein
MRIIGALFQVLATNLAVPGHQVADRRTPATGRDIADSAVLKVIVRVFQRWMSVNSPDFEEKLSI